MGKFFTDHVLDYLASIKVWHTCHRKVWNLLHISANTLQPISKSLICRKVSDPTHPSTNWLKLASIDVWHNYNKEAGYASHMYVLIMFGIIAIEKSWICLTQVWASKVYGPHPPLLSIPTFHHYELFISEWYHAWRQDYHIIVEPAVNKYAICELCNKLHERPLLPAYTNLTGEISFSTMCRNTTEYLFYSADYYKEWDRTFSEARGNSYDPVEKITKES